MVSEIVQKLIDMRDYGSALREFDLLTLTDKQRVELYEYVLNEVNELLKRDMRVKAMMFMRMVLTNQLQENALDTAYDMAQDEYDEYLEEISSPYYGAAIVYFTPEEGYLR